jgi:multicomponent Na+:H+ antiporter subunit G
MIAGIEIVPLLSGALLLAGAVFILIGAFGMHRMPDLFTRMQAASLIDSIGASLILLGLAVHSGYWQDIGKLFILFLLFFFASPAATHALARAAMARGLKPMTILSKRDE